MAPATCSLSVQRDNLPEGLYQQFKQWDIGDIIGGSGAIFRTQKGELSVKPTELRYAVTKSLRPLPEKFHGLTDTETRYRQRYVDLIMNEDSKKVFHTRAQGLSVLSAISWKRRDGNSWRLKPP